MELLVGGGTIPEEERGDKERGGEGGCRDRARSQEEEEYTVCFLFFRAFLGNTSIRCPPPLPPPHSMEQNANMMISVVLLLVHPLSRAMSTELHYLRTSPTIRGFVHGY